MCGICTHQVEARFGFSQLHLQANANEMKTRDVTEVGMRAPIHFDFLALFTEVPTTDESCVLCRDLMAARKQVRRIQVPESVGEM
jgi:hypothetical protein